MIFLFFYNLFLLQNLYPHEIYHLSGNIRKIDYNGMMALFFFVSDKNVRKVLSLLAPVRSNLTSRKKYLIEVGLYFQ